jgi:sterol desaturase/sphingolipid hydroxylase (fatty acid hydroxylase superfamily)
MMIKDRSRPQRIRLFRDERLEKLTVISPLGFAAVWLIVLSLVVYASWGVASIAASTGLVLLGLVLWTLVEYVMHRFIFHLKLRSELGQRLIFLTHGNHHVDPADGYRNIMPPIVSLWVMGSFWGFFVLLLGAAGSVLFLGFAIGYVIYDSVHYACHQFPMRGPVLRQLKRHHIRHHYAKREGNFAITAIFWDGVFGTHVPAKER